MGFFLSLIRIAIGSFSFVIADFCLSLGWIEIFYLVIFINLNISTEKTSFAEDFYDYHKIFNLHQHYSLN